MCRREREYMRWNCNQSFARFLRESVFFYEKKLKLPRRDFRSNGFSQLDVVVCVFSAVSLGNKQQQPKKKEVAFAYMQKSQKWYCLSRRSIILAVSRLTKITTIFFEKQNVLFFWKCGNGEIDCRKEEVAKLIKRVGKSIYTLGSWWCVQDECGEFCAVWYFFSLFVFFTILLPIARSKSSLHFFSQTLIYSPALARVILPVTRLNFFPIQPAPRRKAILYYSPVFSTLDNWPFEIDDKQKSISTIIVTFVASSRNFPNVLFLINAYFLWIWKDKRWIFYKSYYFSQILTSCNLKR